MWLVNFVKEKEGFRSEAYQDAVGVWTIGYGTTKGVKPHHTITEEEAVERLEEELRDFLDYVVNFSEANGYNWENNKIAALTSFIYNLGKGALKQVTSDAKRTNKQIANKMLLYVNAGGKPLPGLITRRKEESDHFKGE